MKKNMGAIDKMIRLAMAVVIVILYYLDILSGTLGIVFLVLAAVLVVTSLISFCPLYALLGFSSSKSSKAEETK